MCEITEPEKAYLAGFIDGEGCISIAKNTSKRTPTPIYYLIVAVSSCDKDVLNYWCGKTNLGHVKTQNKANGFRKVGYAWWLTSIQAEKLLREVYPYLMLKREQADIAFKFRETFYKKWYGIGENCVKGGGKVDSDIIHMRERYKQALTRMKGHLSKRGRLPSNVVK